jgi:hypothetical protein
MILRDWEGSFGETADYILGSVFAMPYWFHTATYFSYHKGMPEARLYPATAPSASWKWKSKTEHENDSRAYTLSEAEQRISV